MPVSTLILGLGPPALVAGYAWWRRRKRGEAPPNTPAHRDPHEEPVDLPDDDVVQPSACSCSAGMPDATEAQIAACVWAGLYPDIAWPPVPGDHPSIMGAADVVLEAVDHARKGACIIDGEPVEPDEAQDAIDITKYLSVDPWPGHFYQVKKGDDFLGPDGVIARAIHRATYEAALGAGRNNAVALQLATANAADAGNRTAYLHQIQCSAWNAALYGSKVFTAKSIASPNGLAIRRLPMHAPNYDRIASGLAPQRRMNVETGTGKAGVLEFLWFPPLVHSALLDMNRQIQVSTAGLVWPDGSSKTLPPPQIQALGMENVPVGIIWGCN